MTTLAHMVMQWSECRGRELAFRQIDRQMAVTDECTWSELETAARYLGARLLDAGVLLGEPVLVAAREPLPYLRAVLACWWAGAAAVPLPHSRGRRATALTALAQRLCAPRFGLREDIFTRTRVGDEPTWLSLDWKHGRMGLDEPLCAPDATALIQLSSGSTAAPKAVQLLHRHLAANQRTIQKAFGHDASARIVGWLPLNHDMGLIGNVLQNVHLGAICTLLPARDFTLDPLSWPRAVSMFEGTTSGGPDSAYAIVADLARASGALISKLSLGGWRVAFSGAEPIRAATLRLFADTFAPHGFDVRAQLNCYGLAEASLLVTAGPARDQSGNLPSDDLIHCGVSPSDVILRIVDPVTRQRVDDGQEGEIWVAGPSVAVSYWGNSEVTERQIRAICLDESKGSRFLRTGDVGLIHESRLVVRGRLDDRMSVMGRKIDADEVEQRIAEVVPGLHSDRVAVFQRTVATSGGAGLGAVIEGRIEVTWSEARDRAVAAVAESFGLPLQVVGFARAGKLPRTTSGKRRRQECARMFEAGHFRQAPIAGVEDADPSGALCQVLGRMVRPEELHNGWRMLGGDSLSAARYTARLRSMGLSISVDALLGAESVAEVLYAGQSIAPGGIVHEQCGMSPSATVARRSDDLSSRLLRQSQLDGGAGASHVEWAAWLGGNRAQTLDVIARRWVWMGEAFQALRMTFVETTEDLTLVVRDETDSTVPLVDARGWSADRIIADMRMRRAQPFQAGAPLFRFIGYRADENDLAAILIVAHHSVCDLASMRRLVPILFDATPAIADDAASYAALRNAMLSWADSAEPAETFGFLEVPTDRRAQAQPDFRGAEQTRTLSARQVRGLAQAASGADCSMAELMVTLWGLVLMRMGDATTGEVDLAVDLRPLHGLNGVVGCGIGVTTLRFDLDATQTLCELIQSIGAQVRAAVAGCPRRAGCTTSGAIATPAADLRAAFRWIDQSDSTLLGYGGAGWTVRSNGGEEFWVCPLRLPTDAVQWSLELTVSALEEGGAFLHLAYVPGRYDSSTARAVLEAFVAAAEAVADHGTRGLASQWPMINVANQARLERWSRGMASGRPLTTLLALLADDKARADDVAVVDRTPLVFEGTSLPVELTYAALHSLSSRLAKRLKDEGAGPGTVVGLALQRSSLLIVAMIAVLRTGAAFAPLNPKDVAVRRNLMLADIGCKLVLTAGTLEAAARVIDLSGSALSMQCMDLEIHDRVASEALAYAMFTSGSTGCPKAVLIEHGAIAARLQAMAVELAITREDVVLHKAAPTFDVAMWEILLPLVCGARLVVVSPGVERDADALFALIGGEGATVVHFVPSMLAAFLAGREAPCAGGKLRRVICSGEALTVSLRDQALRAFDGVELWNYYGPTEAAIDVCIHRATRGQACSAIGRPVADTRLVVLDRWGGLAPVGASGELHIGGRQLARGYAGQSELTDSAFHIRDGERLYATGDRVRWLENGVLEHFGRRDDQWKIRGQRIERAEIEAALRTLPGIADAAVVGRHRRDGTLHLEAHLVAVPGDVTPDRETVLECATQVLPAIMLPSRLAIVSSLPLSINGKIDRNALPVLPAHRSREVAVQADPIELLLCEAIAAALQLTGIGPDDGFFALGGDSLSAIRVVALARERGLAISVAHVYEAPTARMLARVVSRQGSVVRKETFDNREDPVLPIMRSGDAFPLSSAQKSLLFLSEADERYEVYVTSLKLRGPFDGGLLDRAVQGVLDRHPFLRLVCDPLALPEPMQVLLDRAEICVDVRDSRAMDPAKHGDVLNLFIDEERRRPFDWHRAPLLRVTVHRWRDDEFQLTVSDPSMDGWCVATVLTEIIQRYVSLLTGTCIDDAPAAEHFRAFVELERRTLADPRSRAYWSGVLARGEGGVPTFPRGRSIDSNRSRRRMLRFSEVVRSRLEATARLTGCSLRHVLLAAHAVALWCLRGRAGGWVCVEVTGRPETAGGDESLGVYNNIVPVIIDHIGRSWRDLVAAAASGERALLPHRRFPYAELRAMAGGDLADAVFVHTHFYPYRSLANGPVRLVDLTATDQTYVPLTSHFTLDPLSDDLLVLIDHDEVVYDRLAVAGYEEALRVALTALALRPHDDVHAAPAPAPASRETLQPPLPVVEAILAQARRMPDAVALEQDSRQYTYRVLLRRASAVAGALAARSLGPESLVVLDLPFGPDLLTGMVGCLIAGVGFVPLGSAASANRLAAILDAARPALVLHGGAWKGPTGDAIPRLAFDAAVACLPVTPQVVEQDALAYVLFTSGSTGRPKGVAVGRHQLGAYLAWAARSYAFASGRGAGVVTGGDVDMSITPLFGPLVTGRRVTFASEVGDIASLRRLAADPDLGVLKLAPSHLDALAAFGGLPRPSNWPAELILGGEDIAPRHLAMLDQARCAVVNEYGPTETTVGCLAAWLPLVPREAGCVTLGQPTGGAHPSLVDPFGNTPQPGLPGEIVVTGAQVTRGYLSDPSRTAASFRPAAGGRREYYTGDYAVLGEDGQWRYLGRIDRQTKVNGRRLELGEVEEFLLRDPDVANVCCSVVLTEDGRTLLGACVVPRAGVSIEPVVLRSRLVADLPSMFVPSRIVVVDALPLSAAGKVDQSRVREWLSGQPTRGSLESMLRQIEDMSDDDVATELARLSGANKEVAL